jgi:Predicted membrane protein
VPHGYPRSWTLLREGLAAGSNQRRQLLRIGLACLAAGLIAGALDLQRAYWAVAAALLMLHQGLTWPRTLQRSLERTLGTWAGLALAGAILWLHPTGPWLALTVMALQFTIEMVVVRNYALAVVFITSAALTIASGGQPVDDIPGMLLARGVDTVIGCGCALLAFRLLPPRANARTVASEIGQCLLAIQRVCPHLARGEVTTPQARIDRRDLQHRSFLLEQALDQALDGSAEERRSASEHWPAVAACQRLVYRVLAACWDLEREAEAEAPARDSAQASAKALPQAPADDPGSMDAAVEALSSLSRAWTHGEPPPRLPHGLPPLFAGDLGDLHRFLRQKLRAS